MIKWSNESAALERRDCVPLGCRGNLDSARHRPSTKAGPRRRGCRFGRPSESTEPSLYLAVLMLSGIALDIAVTACEG